MVKLVGVPWYISLKYWYKRILILNDGFFFLGGSSTILFMCVVEYDLQVGARGVFCTNVNINM